MKLYLKTKDYSVSGEDFELIYDKEKEMLVTTPVPQNLDKYYQSENYISHTDSKKSLIDRLYQAVKLWNLKKKVQIIDNQIVKRKSILDFGAGTGDFLAFSKAKGFEVFGIEPNASARRRAQEKEVQLVPNIQELAQKKFQVITLWHVLEHLPNVDTHIEQLIPYLENEGVLIVAVPNYKSWDAKHYKSFWAAYDVPRHLSHFSRTAIAQIFDKHGLKLVSIRPMIFDAFYVSMLSEKYKGSNLHFVKGFFKGLWSNLNALFTKEYSSLIYVLKKQV
ncbi:class I SAM-dependent methyltransferase [Flagellimonas allohymeniacidonis]|uniref:Class I SAM-dependent methyltransferase n=1 Tax=Flagellimonas allohymeniacidonis TaxID=2517819 RepID=A0A4Q8QEG0_9FLAO|nr:class I SAM-dependent methyltransferase [Allomuricauda hymeniacidonis]TAI47558.1 class I SAM-dependent methyltransferase [Allomuricauda hymeniacidonis]